jgi:hypothetical protein
MKGRIRDVHRKGEEGEEVARRGAYTKVIGNV